MTPSDAGTSAADHSGHDDRAAGHTDHTGHGAAWDGSQLTVDARGHRCPLPVIELARRIREVDVNADLQLWADDPAAAYDIPAWCRMRANTLVATRELASGGTAYLVRRCS